MIKIEDVLVKPIVTEKTVSMKDKFSFVVHSDATKEDITKAIKEFYGIDVKSINIIKLPSKVRMIRRGQVIQKRAQTKKAIVTVPKGTSIDFNAYK